VRNFVGFSERTDRRRQNDGAHRRKGGTGNAGGESDEARRLRFLSYVRQESSDSCWLWEGTRNKKTGYGIFYWGKDEDTGRYLQIGAHLAAWRLFRGSTNGKNVCHTCDNRVCVNFKKHLWLGTQKENLADCKAKGRSKTMGPRLRGAANGRAVLDADDVRIIRRWHSAYGFSIAYLARLHNVGESTVRHIVQGKTWVTV
jgi:hypothetical protein